MIIVLGAPRTGTTSCARALEELNLSVLQYCPITRSDTRLNIDAVLKSGKSDFDAIVSSHFNESLVSQWIDNFPDATFIHCTRSENDRITSLNTLGYTADISKQSIIRSKNALKQTGRYFELGCDWSDHMKWTTLKTALELNNDQLPQIDFPHNNTSATKHPAMRT